MSSKHELVLDFSELRYVSVSCPHCKSVMTLDITIETTKGRLARCGRCDAETDKLLAQGIEDYREAYRKLSQFASVVQVRVEETKKKSLRESESEGPKPKVKTSA